MNENYTEPSAARIEAELEIENTKERLKILFATFIMAVVVVAIVMIGALRDLG